MIRFIAQVMLLLVVLAFAWWKGGKEERYVASVYLGLMLAGIAHWLATGEWSETAYGSLQLYRFFCDLIALAIIVAIAIRYDRWWTLWVGSIQFIAVVAHLLKAADLPVGPLIYAIMERWPSWIALLTTALGTWSYARRKDGIDTTT